MTKKLFFCLIIGMIATVASLAQGNMQEISGYCGKDGDNIKWTVNIIDSTLVFDGTGEMAIYNYNDHPWRKYSSAIKYVSVGNGIVNVTANAFYKMKITSISLPSSLTEIGSYSFYKCDSLHSIFLPDGITKIGAYAFRWSGLTKIKIPFSIKDIEAGTFESCSQLEDVLLPDGIKSIGSDAFSSCTKLSKIELPVSLVSLENNAFYSCGLKNIKLPETLKTIGNGTFSGCYLLSSIDLPSSLERIGAYAFSGTGLKTIVLPSSITKLENGVFNRCDNLTEIDFLYNIEEIGEDCFRECKSLQQVTIPQKMQMVGSGAFQSCPALEKVIIEWAPYLSSRTFGYCTSLTNVVLSDDFNPFNMGNDVFVGCTSLPPLYNSTGFLYMPNNNQDSYSIPEGIICISNSAFKGNKFLKHLYLPSSIQQIRDYAFASSAIEEIDLSNLEFVWLGEGVFSNSNITRIIFSNKISNVPYRAFEGCQNLISIDLSGIREEWDNPIICKWAFMNCEKLNKVVLPESIGRIDIEIEAFKNCRNLESINFAPVGSIGIRAFNNCTSLRKIELSDFGTDQTGASIGYEAFAGCTSLDSLIIGSSGLQRFYMSAFEDCNNLKSVIITSEYVLPITDLNQDPYYGLEGKSFEDFNLPFGNTTFTMFGYMADYCIENAADFWNKVNIERIYEELSGECGDEGNNIIWSLNTEEGVLRLVGVGNMKLPDNTDLLTWKDRRRAVKEIFLSDSIESICSKAFYRCAVKSITLNKNLRSIGDYAFCDCYLLERITFNDSLKAIENSAFEHCNLLNNVVLNDGLERIGDGAFHNCYRLEQIFLPSTIISTGQGVFVDCTSLKSVSLPKNIVAVPEYTFSGCSNLETVVLANDTKSIGSYAFSSCYKLVNFYCPAIVPPIPTGWGGKHLMWNDMTIYIPKGTTETYKYSNLLGRYKMCEYYAYIGIQAGSGGQIVIEDTISTCQWNDYHVLGQPFEISVIPDDYYNVQSLTVNGDELLSMLANGKLQFDELHDNKDIIVKFAPYDYSLSLSVHGRGHILLNEYDIEISGKLTITHEDQIEMKFIPNEGYKVDSVIVNGVNVTAMLIDGKYIVEYPTDNVNVETWFNTEVYNLVYIVDNMEYKTDEVKYEDTITPEPVPIKEGYTFSGWSDIPETMPAHDVTITGTFTINKYKLTYMIDGKVYKEKMYEYGATISPEAQPEGDYDTFKWTDLPQTMPAHDVVVYASYTSGIIEVLMTTQRNIRIYSPNGKKLDKLQKGMNIIRMNDGRTKKIVVK